MTPDKKEKKGYRYIFGPVPSRRLGLSLGVDLVPHKTCTLDCVYCECGRTTNLTTTRREYVPVDPVIAELTDFLSGKPGLDYITFSGSGEPMLNTGIGEIIRFLLSDHPSYKIALLTNGTLFTDNRVIKEISDVHVVKLSVDGGTEEIFKRINRPHTKLDYESLVDGWRSLRKGLKSRLWVECFIVPGCNDDKNALKNIKKRVKCISPDKIHLNTLDRPGVERWVGPAGKQALAEIETYLDDASIISLEKTKKIADDPYRDLDRRIFSTIRRRPLTVEDLSRLLNMDSKATENHLAGLVKQGEIKKKSMPRGVFYLMRSKND